MHSIGTLRPSMFGTPISNRCACLGLQDNSESHAGIGVTAVWPRHRPVIPTGRQPANIPNQRCGAVGSLAVNGEEEVTVRRLWDVLSVSSPPLLAHFVRSLRTGHPPRYSGELT